MPKFTYLTTKALVCALALQGAVSAPAAFAQGSQGIAAVVNEDIVTSRDLTQRVLFMVATTGAERDEATLQRIQTQALRNLVDEHIQMQESKKFDQSIGDTEVDRSVGNLFSRNGLDPNEVVERLAAIGVSVDTLRDQVRSEIAWQRIVNGLYGSRIRISDAQIDDTLNRLTANASKPNYRVSEIHIEAREDIGGMDGAMEGARAMIAQIEDGAPFALLAQQFSSAPTAAKGGDVGWVREGEMREELDAAIQSMEPGSVSKPIQVPGGVYVLAVLEKKISESDTVYKLKQVNFGRNGEVENEDAKARLIALKETLTSCDTLTADTKDIDAINTVDLGEVKTSDMSDLILDAIGDTNVGALSDPIITPAGPVAVLICNRRLSGTDVPTRDAIEDRLMDQQLAQASKRHLRDLRRQATIVLR